MLDIRTAKAIVAEKLAEMCPGGDHWLVVDDKTIERDFGWIFFYNSEKYLSTRSVMHRLAGNGPVFVNKRTGAVEFFGSTPAFESLLKAYESKLSHG